MYISFNCPISPPSTHGKMFWSHRGPGRHSNFLRMAERTNTVMLRSRRLNFPVANLSFLSLFDFMITMSSSLRRLTPRALTPAWKLPRSYQHPGRFFRAQPAPTRFLRQSGLDFTTPLSKNQLRNSSTDASEVAKSPESLKAVLPTCCPGCGAYAQTVEPNEPGYYGKTRKQTKKKPRKAQNLKEPTMEEAANALDEATEEIESAPKPLRRYLSIMSSLLAH